jgi:hypothetical protein
VIPIALVLTLIANLSGWGATPEIIRNAEGATTAAVQCGNIPGDMFRTDASLTIINNTAKDYTLFSSEIDCYDFSGSANPSQYDGLTVPANSESATYPLAARRVCPWLPYIPFPTWQSREAHWTTGISATDAPADLATIRSSLTCQGSQSVTSMCQRGYFQTSESFPVLFDQGMIRANLRCENNGHTTLTLSTIY